MNENFKTRSIALIVSLLILGVGVTVQAKPNGGLKPGIDFSGPHFNLNVHGVPVGVEKPVPDDAGPGRHSVFMPVETAEPVQFFYSMQGKWWVVNDCDATGDGTISITLPRELWDEGLDGIRDTADDVKIGNIGSYRVYAVALGQPSDGIISMDPDATYTAPDATLGVGQTIFVELTDNPLTVSRAKGKPVWVNGTYLFLATAWVWTADLNLDGNWWLGDSWDGTIEDCDAGEVTVYTDYWVFDIPELLNYFWDVSNTGVRLMQVRFYPILK